MLFTIIGGIAGLYLAYFIADMTGIDLKGPYAIGGTMFVLSGLMLGAGIGFGYGTGLLMNGNHPFNMILGSKK